MDEDFRYQDENAETVDRWVADGWEWSVPVSHEEFLAARKGDWSVKLTPTVKVPADWFGDIAGKKLLGLASGGGQQMPLFTAAGALCTVLDYSRSQLDREREVAEREGYSISIIRYDMTRPLPFADEQFDIIFHPVSNCYVREVEPIWRECARILKPGGVLLSGFDNGFNFLFDESETEIVNTLPFDPIKNADQRFQLMVSDGGYQFSHTISEQIGGQLRAGFRLTDIYEDTNGSGFLHEHGAPTFYATRCVKE